MMRVINKMLPSVNAEPNTMEIGGTLPLQIYRSTYQHRTRRYFFWVTTNAGAAPSVPSQKKASTWERDSVLTRLLSRKNSTGVQQDVRHTKRHKGDTDVLVGANPAHKTTENAASLPVSTANEDTEMLVVEEATPDLASSYGGWWNSGDARKLFAPCKLLYDADCDVKEIVLERIEILESVNCLAANWMNVADVRCASSVEKSHYSESDVFSLRYRSLYLALALKQFVLHVTNDLRTQWTWKQSLNWAIKSLNDVGIEYYSSSVTLRKWHRKFAMNRFYFFQAPGAKNVCPRFFVDNPDAMDAFKKHAIANIKDLRVEFMLEYVHHELVPKLMLKRENSSAGCFFDDNGDETAAVDNCNPVAAVVSDEIEIPSTRTAFLQSYGLSTISIATIARWMHACGFRYKKREKHYFVDGHERPETLKYRPVFTKEYLGYEVRAHRWFHMTLAESNTLLSEGKIAAKCGYYYTSDDGVDMVEYHIDTSYALEERLLLLPFGGNLSVRKPVGSKIVMYVGQDEAIFKQFLFLTKMWVGPNGERPLLPKDEGTGTMISAFISREHGLIREVSPEILAQVNLQRDGEKYADQDAAIEINGSPNKQPLTFDKSPFLVYFEYGENKEGYWAYSNMVLQFEDAVDVLKIMHPEFEYVFLFDHSSGHAKQRPDGLNQHRMNRAFGGKTPPMRNTLIIEEEGFLGQFPRILEPGDTQSLVFSEADTGPFWMSDSEKSECRMDKHLGNTNSIKLTSPELILQLREQGVEDTGFTVKSIRQLRNLSIQHGLSISKDVAIVHERNRTELEIDLRTLGVSTKGKNKRELVEMCRQHQITITKNVEKVREGWQGKSKGLLQVLWERGLIDGDNLNNYALTGKKDELGTVDNSTSLRHIMGMCTDFLNEEGMLQHVAKGLGVKILLTPKCHAELAGEGVEYVWACAKGAYRNLSLQQKRGKDNFKASVRRCLSEEVITTVRIRRFARRARQYMMAYYAIDTQQVDEQTQHDCAIFGPVALTKLIGDFKTHRCVFDFDYRFIMSCA